MTKRETFQLLKLIAETYPTFTFEQTTVEDWSKRLLPIPFETILETFDRFAAESINPPTVKDFIFQHRRGRFPRFRKQR